MSISSLKKLNQITDHTIENEPHLELFIKHKQQLPTFQTLIESQEKYFLKNAQENH